jgi:hypothetical protein
MDKRAELREQFIAKALTITKQLIPDFYSTIAEGNHRMTPEQYVAFARYKIAQCEEKIPLDFELMKKHARDVDITHDFFGIMNNWNVISETMENCFHPRCAK